MVNKAERFVKDTALSIYMARGGNFEDAFNQASKIAKERLTLNIDTGKYEWLSPAKSVLGLDTDNDTVAKVNSALTQNAALLLKDGYNVAIPENKNLILKSIEANDGVFTTGSGELKYAMYMVDKVTGNESPVIDSSGRFLQYPVSDFMVRSLATSIDLDEGDIEDIKEDIGLFSKSGISRFENYLPVHSYAQLDETGEGTVLDTPKVVTKKLQESINSAITLALRNNDPVKTKTLSGVTRTLSAEYAVEILSQLERRLLSNHGGRITRASDIGTAEYQSALEDMVSSDQYKQISYIAAALLKNK